MSNLSSLFSSLSLKELSIPHVIAGGKIDYSSLKLGTDMLMSLHFVTLTASKLSLSEVLLNMSNFIVPKNLTNSF